jgi:hypothetical protein
MDNAIWKEISACSENNLKQIRFYVLIHSEQNIEFGILKYMVHMATIQFYRAKEYADIVICIMHGKQPQLSHFAVKIHS